MNPNKLRVLLLGAAACCVIALSGCMYPREMRKENNVAAGEYAVVVQNAVDKYRSATGVPPIKNKDEDTPLYEKYPVDFKKLKERKYLSSIPANAFENGGTAIYVLVDPETKTEVKLLDLAAYQQTVELQKKVDDYIYKNSGQIPKGATLAPPFFSIDFSKLNMKAEQAQSPYTRSVYLPFIVDETGRVGIDYAVELMKLIERKGVQGKLDAKQDLRELLVAESYYVPVRSFPYHWQNGQPILSNR